jgi:hypothetical protein
MKVRRYEPAQREAWNAFVLASRNGTFLFDRGYMEYHADRFTDHSLVFTGDRDEIVAVLPANRSGDRLASHGGLTYGGLVVGERLGTGTVLQLFDTLREHMRGEGLATVLYKTVPHIYHRYPAEEDRYALFRAGARLTRRDVLAVLRPQDRPAYQDRRARMMRKARGAGITVAASEDYAAFWSILSENLERIHGARPVHSLDEIRLLHLRFPSNIRLFLASDAAGPVAGVVIYDTGRVAHVQYIGSNERGREAGALDLLFATLIEETCRERPWFDFGISNEDEGRVLNVGLIEQKEGFGARAVAHDFYEVAA